MNMSFLASQPLAFAPVHSYLPVDIDRDMDEIAYAHSADAREFEVAPTQRNRYFSAYPLAVEQDAIEQGILPLTQAIFDCGGYPQFSCEGHPENTGDNVQNTSYVCFWVPPENIAHWNRLQACFTDNWLWAKVRVSVDDSQYATLGSSFSGQPGQFISVYFTLRKQWKPTSEATRGQEMKHILTQTHARVASRLRAIAL